MVDPFKASFWDQWQVEVWVVWRDHQFFQKVSDAYGGGQRALTIQGQKMYGATYVGPTIVHGSMADLLMALQSGELKAHAKRTTLAEGTWRTSVEEVPAHLWRYLDWSTSGIKSTVSDKWEEFSFSSADVLKLFPALGTTPEENTSSQANDQREGANAESERLKGMARIGGLRKGDKLREVNFQADADRLWLAHPRWTKKQVCNQMAIDSQSTQTPFSVSKAEKAVRRVRQKQPAR